MNHSCPNNVTPLRHTFNKVRNLASESRESSRCDGSFIRLKNFLFKS